LKVCLDSIRDFPPATASSDGGRWFLLDVIKAIGCVLIVWHHLAVYSPMFDRAMWLAPDPLAALYNHGQLAVQAFLVVAGFLSAAQLLRFVPENAQGLPTGFSVPRLLAKRYLRLAIPLMAALTLTVCVTALVRPWYPHDSLSDAPRVWTLVVHALMLQDLIGVPALSAGIWYVAIDLQLFTIALGCVWLAGLIQLRQPRFNLRGVTVLLWLVLSALSLNWWNRQENLDVQGLYFFGSYGLGMLAYRVRLSRITAKGWAIIFVLGLFALWLEPRMRLGLAWGMALLLAAWPSTGSSVVAASSRTRWQRGISSLAQTSYSVFLVHFAVSLLVSAAWFHADWQDPWANLAGMCLSFVLSLFAGTMLYRAVEHRTATWSHLLQWQVAFGLSGGLALALT
jgi:peptidoglycan/LPS O-acetylase OafA/YrhL